MPINGSTRSVGVFGHPVSHSRSPLMHNRAIAALGINWTYVPFDVDPARIGEAVSAVRALNLIGVNITVPLKELIAPHLDWIDPIAQRINSINTVVNDCGKLLGYSTDGPGLLWDLADKKALPAEGGRVLILGAGGSARSVAWASAQAGYQITISNRTISRAKKLTSDLGLNCAVVAWDAQDLSDAASRANLIVNTTSIGLSSAGNVERNTLSRMEFCAGSVLYDLVYSPPVTDLMARAAGYGARVYNGFGMLVRQGALSLALWLRTDSSAIPVQAMEDALSGD